MPDLSLLPSSAAIDGNDLRIGDCSLTEVAAEFGTPAFIFDEQALRARARAFADGLARRHRRSRVCFATKAFPSSSMVSILASEGLGFDVVGEGELRIALAGGADPAKIVMHGNAKSDEDRDASYQADASSAASQPWYRVEDSPGARDRWQVGQVRRAGRARS
jgi:diaminopimelate decarboxylase